MMTSHRSGQSYFFISLAFGLAIFAGVAGVARCFVESPQAKADAYLQMSINAQYNDTDLALDAAMEAARHNPVSVQAWRQVSETLLQAGDETASRQALIIAKKLQHNPVDAAPIYAMPAELRLSFLGRAGGEF